VEHRHEGGDGEGQPNFFSKKKTIVKVSRHVYTCTQIRYSTKSLIANVKVWVSVSHNRVGREGVGIPDYQVLPPVKGPRERPGHVAAVVRSSQRGNPRLKISCQDLLLSVTGVKAAEYTVVKHLKCVIIC
jgi:hypothetical protein